MSFFSLAPYTTQVTEKLGLAGDAPLFSFQYADKKGNEAFLKLDKKCLSQDLNKKEVRIPLEVCSDETGGHMSREKA